MGNIAFHTKKIERGDVFYVESIFNEEGSEQRAGRPAIIVSNDKGNEYGPIVSVVYLTTAPKNYQPTHVTIRSSPKPSTALCEQVTTVAKTRLGDYLCTCTEAEMDQVDIAITIALGIDCGKPTVKEVVKEVVVEKPVEVIKIEKQVEVVEVPAPADDNAALVKALAERDLFERMYQDILAKLIGKMN